MPTTTETKIPAFRCVHSGLYFPGDYCREWGRKYGIGLGKDPCSEVLDSDYGRPITIPAHDARQAMFPVGVTRAQITYVEVTQAEFDAKRAIIAQDDPMMIERAKVIRAKQAAKSTHLAAILNNHKENDPYAGI